MFIEPTTLNEVEVKVNRRNRWTLKRNLSKSEHDVKRRAFVTHLCRSNLFFSLPVHAPLLLPLGSPFVYSLFYGILIHVTHPLSSRKCCLLPSHSISCPKLMQGLRTKIFLVQNPISMLKHLSTRTF